MGRAREEYTGEFKGDRIEGFGQVVYANGDAYEGYYRDNKKDGKGKYISKSKEEVYVGTWTLDVKNGTFTEEKKKEGLITEG
jgi:hypothetical protein